MLEFLVLLTKLLLILDIFWTYGAIPFGSKEENCSFIKSFLGTCYVSGTVLDPWSGTKTPCPLAAGVLQSS